MPAMFASTYLIESGRRKQFIRYSDTTYSFRHQFQHLCGTMACSPDLQSNHDRTYSPEQEAQEVHRLEQNDFSCSVARTRALRHGLLQHAMVTSDEKSNKPCLHFVLRHFVLESLGTVVENLEIDKCSVSIGVITGCQFLAVQPLTGTTVTRKRGNPRYAVYCWFIPLATVQYRVCLLTLLGLEELQSMSSMEIVNAIKRGDLGYYSIPRFEFRRISNCIDASFLLSQNDAVFQQPEIDKENHTVVLFSQVNPEFALSQLHVNWKIGFYCDEATYAEVVIPALADMPGIVEKKLWTTAEFVFKRNVPNQLFVVDLEFMGKCGTVESHLALLNITPMVTMPPRVLVFGSPNGRKIMDRYRCDNFVCAKMDKRNLVYYILVDIINALSDFRWI